MKKENDIYYEKKLTDKEIYNYALIIDEFRREQITYKELQEKFSNEYGIEVDADIIIGKTYKYSEELNDYCTRIARENFKYNDILFFVLSGKDFNNVLFRLDYKAIKLLTKSVYVDESGALKTTGPKLTRKKDDK